MSSSKGEPFDVIAGNTIAAIPSIEVTVNNVIST
jgi:hypothetical protein